MKPEVSFRQIDKLLHTTRIALVLAGVVLVSTPLSADQPATQPTSTVADADTVVSELKPKPQPGWLDQVIISATRSETSLFNAPYSGDTVHPTRFDTNRQYKSLTDALKDVPGVMIQKTAGGMGSPYLRGFTGFRTLLMFDGIRLNNSTMRDGPNQYWNTIDQGVVDRLEVVRGPSSVLFGSDAIGGTVNVIPRRKEFLDGGDFYGQLQYVYTSANNAHAGRAEFGASFEKQLGILVGGSLRTFDDIRAGGGTGLQHFTGYDEWSGDLRMEHLLSKDAKLIFGHYNFHQDDAWRTHKTIHGISWEGTSIGNERHRILDQRRTLTYMQYHHENLGAFIDAVRLSLSWQETAETQWRMRSDGRSDKQGVDVDTLGMSVQFETPSPIGKWTYGAEAYFDDVQSWKHSHNADGSFNSRDVQGPVGDDARYNLVGVYVQDEISLTDSFDVTLGTRYTHSRADAGRVKDPVTGNPISVRKHWDSLVSSARARWYLDPDERLNLFGGVSQGFRAPNLSDLTRLDTARSGEIETASADVEPERFVSYELGIKARCRNFSAQAAYFYNDIDDMIMRTPTGAVIGGDNEVTKQNVGDGYMNGFEIAARYRLHPQFTAFGDVAWVYGKAKTFPTSAPNSVSEPISRLMPPTGRIGVRWDHPSRKYWLETSCTIAGTADPINTRDERDNQRIPDGGTPGYSTVGVRGGWKVRDGLDLWAGVENITNTNYRIHGSGNNEPGTNVKVGLRWRF